MNSSRKVSLSFRLHDASNRNSHPTHTSIPNTWFHNLSRYYKSSPHPPTLEARIINTDNRKKNLSPDLVVWALANSLHKSFCTCVSISCLRWLLVGCRDNTIKQKGCSFFSSSAFTAHIPCAWCCSRHCGYSSELDRHHFYPHGACIL